MRRSEPLCVNRNKMDARAAQGRQSGGSGTVQCADAICLIDTIAGAWDQAHCDHPFCHVMRLACADGQFLCDGLIPAAPAGRSKYPWREEVLWIYPKLNKIKILFNLGEGKNRFPAIWRLSARPIPRRSRSSRTTHRIHIKRHVRLPHRSSGNPAGFSFLS